MFADRFRVDPDGFRLKDCDPGDTAGIAKGDAPDALQKDIAEMVQLQDRLYADERHALLLIFQAPDAAGKDSTIKHVMSGLNPAGCQVTSFKVPSADELRHVYLWRYAVRLPPRGYIGIFNRSYYEEVLVVRVHPELLAAQKLPTHVKVDDTFWQDRYQDMVRWEKYLRRNGVRVVKFFLNVSKKEQKKRLLARIEQPEKNWKFSAADYGERQHWDDYQAASDAMLRNTSTDAAPWYVIPADHKWFTHLAVARLVVETLRDINPTYPQVAEGQKAELRRFRALLEAEG
jgi:PPK2 family polyphosphate:nucleotide phosphotransferase